MPCKTGFSKCRKKAADGNCVTCSEFEPGRGSKYYRCGRPDIKVSGCSTPRRLCPTCEYFIKDKSRVSYFDNESERMAEWRMLNPEKYAEQQKKYRERHAEERREYMREWRRKNRERLNEYMRGYREGH